MTRLTLPRTACQRDPEQWFAGPDQHAAARACRQCPRRQWCAGHALETQTSFGMWAGVWIDNDLAAKTSQLRAIVAHQPALTVVPELHDAVETDRPAQHRLAGEAAASDAHQTPLRNITARSSGHCEVMAQGCRYSFDVLASRLPESFNSGEHDASCAYAACTTCHQTVRATNAGLLRGLGYLVETPLLTASTPFYWRQARWIYLDVGPTITTTAPEAVLRHAI